MEQEKMGTFIAELRKNKGYTQEKLASKLGVSAKAVSKWENGINMPDISVLPKLSKIFEISIDDIFACKYEKKANKKKYMRIISIIIIFIILASLVLFCSYKYYSSIYRYHVYRIESLNSDYLVDGYFTKNIDNNMLIINHISSKNDIIDENVKVSSVEFKVTSNSKFIYSESSTYENGESLLKILEQTQLFIYTYRKGEFKNEIDVSDIILHLTYIQNGVTIIKIIKINPIPYK